ncbi:MAG: tRNA pseudouridine(38-40) synthase TruA [Planctomycetota bacterium]
MPRYKLTIAYDGTDFAGWQKQEPPDPDATPDEHGDRPRIKLRTVQEIVERAVRETVREPVVLGGASRTDSGVHAVGQCAAFTTSAEAPEGRGWPPERGTEPLRRALNGRLPDDVYVSAVQQVHDGFNPITDATSKGYSYTFHASRDRTLWDRRYVHHVWCELDVDKMHEAAQHLIGEHDFASMAAANHGRQTTVRTIHNCTVTRETDHRIRLDVSGNGFLYNMVRIIAGTLYDVGRGTKESGDIPQILESGDRRQAGMTLPASGLRLEWIEYPETP